ncbi:hypothetical protein OH76DRAFT_537145 [Lentinus brumalis]|uniref:Uncharacterized protein n=1 Tax=Lentinus brumalis TaxID=2498619 RepID=A0A371DAH1_9APHY|nr:hypothetical protein OH76DRAFT_537145 [Polyporus brumalis]
MASRGRGRINSRDVGTIHDIPRGVVCVSPSTSYQISVRTGTTHDDHKCDLRNPRHQTVAGLVQNTTCRVPCRLEGYTVSTECTTTSPASATASAVRQEDLDVVAVEDGADGLPDDDGRAKGDMREEGRKIRRVDVACCPLIWRFSRQLLGRRHINGSNVRPASLDGVEAPRVTQRRGW